MPGAMKLRALLPPTDRCALASVAAACRVARRRSLTVRPTCSSWSSSFDSAPVVMPSRCAVVAISRLSGDEQIEQLGDRGPVLAGQPGLRSERRGAAGDQWRRAAARHEDVGDRLADFERDRRAQPAHRVELVLGLRAAVLADRGDAASACGAAAPRSRSCCDAGRPDPTRGSDRPRTARSARRRSRAGSRARALSSTRAATGAAASRAVSPGSR